MVKFPCVPGSVPFQVVRKLEARRLGEIYFSGHFRTFRLTAEWETAGKILIFRSKPLTFTRFGSPLPTDHRIDRVPKGAPTKAFRQSSTPRGNQSATRGHPQSKFTQPHAGCQCQKRGAGEEYWNAATSGRATGRL